MQSEIHDGHRERMIKKFLDYPDSLSEHELLELVLYSAIPRKDTNELAHRLCDSFGGIKGVFSASEQELTSVSGVGKKIALHLVLLGKVLDKIKSADVYMPYLSSPEKVKEEMKKLFIDEKSEKFYLVLLDGRYKKIFQTTIEGNDSTQVITDLSSMAHALTAHDCKFAIIAHNHPSGNSNPSKADDLATEKFYILCTLHGVKLIDHVIVGDDVYSYFYNGKMEEIKNSIEQKIG